MFSWLQFNGLYTIPSLTPENNDVPLIVGTICRARASGLGIRSIWNKHQPLRTLVLKATLPSQSIRRQVLVVSMVSCTQLTQGDINTCQLLQRCKNCFNAARGDCKTLSLPKPMRGVSSTSGMKEESDIQLVGVLSYENSIGASHDTLNQQRHSQNNNPSGLAGTA